MTHQVSCETFGADKATARERTKFLEASAFARRLAFSNLVVARTLKTVSPPSCEGPLVSSGCAAGPFLCTTDISQGGLVRPTTARTWSLILMVIGSPFTSVFSSPISARRLFCCENLETQSKTAASC